jgi:hypothetical protein
VSLGQATCTALSFVAFCAPVLQSGHQAPCLNDSRCWIVYTSCAYVFEFDAQPRQHRPTACRAQQVSSYNPSSPSYRLFAALCCSAQRAVKSPGYKLLPFTLTDSKHPSHAALAACHLHKKLCLSLNHCLCQLCVALCKDSDSQCTR